MQRRVVVGAFGGVLAAVLVLGTIDTFVWLPEAAAPGVPLDRVYETLGASGDLVACIASPVIWSTFWAVLGALFIALQLPAHRSFQPVVLRPAPAAAVALLLLGATGCFHWWSAFAMGMSVSDELPPGFGTTTTLGLAIAGGGVLVGALGVGVGVVALLTRSRAATATS